MSGTPKRRPAIAPVLFASLPFWLDVRIAAIIEGSDRWEAGKTLMEAGDPGGWSSAGSWAIMAR